MRLVMKYRLGSIYIDAIGLVLLANFVAMTFNSKDEAEKIDIHIPHAKFASLNHLDANFTFCLLLLGFNMISQYLLYIIFESLVDS